MAQRKRLGRNLALVGIVCLGAGLTSPAPTAAASKFRALKGSCGQAIVDPKAEQPTFVLQNDIGPCKTDGLIFKASNVTLDLNGKTIKGMPLVGPAGNPTGGFGEGVGIRLVGNSWVRIINSKPTGGITDFDAGIVIQRGEQSPARGNVVRNVRVYNNVGRQSGVGGVGCDQPASEGSCEVSDFNDGISLVGAENSAIGPGNVVESNGSGGIRIDDGSVNNAIVGNTIRNNLGNGVRFMALSSFNVVSGNTITGNASGVNFSFQNPDNVVEDNTIDANHRFGVSTSWQSQRTLIRNNTVTNNRSGGINLTSGENTVTGNQVLDNGKGTGTGRGNGIFVASGTDNFPRVRTTVSGNTVRGSGGNGIRISCMVDQRDPTTEGGTYDLYGCLVWDTGNRVENNTVYGNAVNAPIGTKAQAGLPTTQVIGWYDLVDSTNADATQSPYDPSGQPLTDCSTNVWSGNSGTGMTAYPACAAGS